MITIPDGQKNWINLLVTNQVIWQLLSGFCLTHPMLGDCNIEEKDLLLVYILKLLRKETREWKFLYFVRTQSERGRKSSRGLAQSSTRSRSAWTMAKVSIDAYAVVERLLWIMTACGMPFEAVPGRFWIGSRLGINWLQETTRPS